MYIKIELASLIKDKSTGGLFRFVRYKKLIYWEKDLMPALISYIQLPRRVGTYHCNNLSSTTCNALVNWRFKIIRSFQDICQSRFLKDIPAKKQNERNYMNDIFNCTRQNPSVHSYIHFNTWKESMSDILIKYLYILS